MNPEKQAAALRKIAEGIYEYADLLFDSPEPVSSGGPVAAVTPSAAAGSMPEFPPLEDWGDTSKMVEFTPQAQSREYVMSRCPTHDKPWTVKEGGMSKNGKPYSAFWRCAGKNADGSFCSKKPDASWVKTHNPEAALV